jgi:hypothetical protein
MSEPGAQNVNTNTTNVDPSLFKTSRRLYYPKFKFNLIFSTYRQFVGYVSVHTRYTVSTQGATPTQSASAPADGDGEEAEAAHTKVLSTADSLTTSITVSPDGSEETIDFNLGTTEARTSELGNSEPILFHKPFEIPYQVGVDDTQLVVFEIYDGDVMMTTTEVRFVG